MPLLAHGRQKSLSLIMHPANLGILLDYPQVLFIMVKIFLYLLFNLVLTFNRTFVKART